jgi:catechol 2,3-dioxygenase
MPETATTAFSAAVPALLPDTVALGGVELTVTDIARSIDFYTRVVGLALQRNEDGRAVLGAGEQHLLVLHENRTATPPARRAGLYHFALLHSSREELARAAMRIAKARARIDGASDHGTHEAIYLPDPDGIGIELAADRPRERWADFSGADFMAHGPAPLDVGNLLESIAGEQPTELAGSGLRMGHVHLHVGDLDSATRFYRDGLGFAVTMELPSAVFFAAGGYHHHVAVNVWRGVGVPPAPPDAIGLRHWTVVLGSDAERDVVRERVDALGFVVDQHDDGLLARDDANIAVLLSLAR